MTAHISDDIPRLLTGDASRDEVLVAAAHLRTCADCQQDLVSAVVAHASLMSAHRFAPEVVAPVSDDAAVEDDEPADVTPLPDLSAVFSHAREEADAAARRPQRRMRLLAVAAAAVVVAGGGVTLATTLGSDHTTVASRSVQLKPFGIGRHTASVTIVANKTMRIDASSLPKLDARHQYEVWLTDDARKRMQSVGFIGNDNRAELAVPSRVMSQYNDIEVSVQRLNQTNYSGTSVLRGSYG